MQYIKINIQNMYRYIKKTASVSNYKRQHRKTMLSIFIYTKKVAEFVPSPNWKTCLCVRRLRLRGPSPFHQVTLLRKLDNRESNQQSSESSGHVACTAQAAEVVRCKHIMSVHDVVRKSGT